MDSRGARDGGFVPFPVPYRLTPCSVCLSRDQGCPFAGNICRAARLSGGCALLFPVTLSKTSGAKKSTTDYYNYYLLFPFLVLLLLSQPPPPLLFSSTPCHDGVPSWLAGGGGRLAGPYPDQRQTLPWLLLSPTMRTWCSAAGWGRMRSYGRGRGLGWVRACSHHLPCPSLTGLMTVRLFLLSCFPFLLFVHTCCSFLRLSLLTAGKAAQGN